MREPGEDAMLSGQAALLATVQAELAQWRAAHPQASFRELEDAVEAQLHRVRAVLLTELAAAEPPRPPACPTCGGPLRAKGPHTRRVVLPGEEAVPLTRAYYHCPACRGGVSPPG
jgi:hypothetical protein